jgi:hypothetical protein
MAKVERTRSPVGLGGYLLAFLATAVVGGVTGGIAAFMAESGSGGIVVTAACAAVGLGLIFLICVAWWNRVDEAAREAHKWAWWWGGTAGTAIGGVFLVVAVAASRGGTSSVLSSTPAADLILGGAFGIMLCQVVGYGIAWAAWWLQRR